jgi:AAA15 family ATPase/GTPase
MLLNYQFKNFCSFKDEVEFSLRATEKVRKIFPENYFCGKVDVLKSAVIVGENAGGKSNFIKSLQYLKKFFKDNQAVEANLEYLNDDFTKSTKGMRYGDTVQTFSIEVLIGDDIYTYDLHIDSLGIRYEKLSVQKNSEEKINPIFIVERSKKDELLEKPFVEKISGEFGFFNLNFLVKLNPNYDKLKNFLQSKPAQNDSIGLYLSKIALLNVPEAINFSNWINNTLCFELAPYYDYESSGERLKNADILKVLNDERFIEILKIIDSSIMEIKPDSRFPYKSTIIVRENSDGQIFERELQFDSAGVRDYFRWAIQIFKVIYENKVLFADEMDRALNPVLSDKIVSLVHGSDHQGQFIFTTHNVFHLNLRKQMKEQIYFVTKDLSTLHSELYSLADFSDVDYDSEVNLYEFYLRGVLGGIIRG